ncbi:MAG TPA: molybdate ABC transporter permease subunit [Methylomirabilota bacterium]|jgi:molybdate transport system permease protein|nr:molybdate ABC transporter permease subunit [Methylomirabilota bacterium]
MSFESLLLSLRLAAIVSLLLLAIALLLAAWLAFGRWRGRFLVEAFVALPLVLPPTVLGFYLLVAMGPRSPLGRLWSGLFGRGLAFSFEGLVVASLLYSLPFAVQPLVSSFRNVDPRLVQASALLGVSRSRTFFRIVLPLSFPGLVTAFVLSFAHTLGEFGVVLMVGGNLPGITRTVSIAIYDSVEAMDYSGAGRLALVLLLISFSALSIVYAVNRRVWSPWTAR